MDVTGVVLTLVALVVVAVIGYRVGYLRGRAELLLQLVPTEAERNELRMNSVLPGWRRVAGWAAYVFSGLLLCLFLAFAYWYAQGWGWSFLLTAWALWFATFLAGIWFAEWCWKSRREAQDGPGKEDSG